MKTTILAKILIGLLFLIFIILPNKSSLALEISPQTIDLGDIQKNRIIHYEIQIKNNELQPIILEKARTSCDCINLEYEKNKSIEKNKSYVIKLILNTTELSEGKLKKFIFLSFRNSEKPIHSIEVRGNILRMGSGLEF